MIAAAVLMAAFVSGAVFAADISYGEVSPNTSTPQAEEVTRYGMLPVYGRDIKDGTYEIRVASGSSPFRAEAAVLTVEGDRMEAALTVEDDGWKLLYLGTAREAAEKGEADGLSPQFIPAVEEEGRGFIYQVTVDGLDKALPCAAFSEEEGQWYDGLLLFDASSLPKEALLVQLPDYDRIEAALAAADGGNGGADENGGGSKALLPVEPMDVELEDGEYSIEVAMAGGSGEASVSSPALLLVDEGKAFARLVWSSANYDYMIVGGKRYDNENQDGGNSTFTIPVAAMDEEVTVIADTTAMGTPHEVEYTMNFYRETIGEKSQMPQEAAKRVVVIALIIIVGGGILNHRLQKKRRA